MLTRKRFRRRHQRCLRAVRRRLESRINRHRRLSRAHVSLQKTIHRRWTPHVDRYLANRMILRLRKFKGKKTTYSRIKLRGSR